MKYIFKKKINTFLIIIFDGLGYALFWLFRRFKFRSHAEPSQESILVIRMDHLGDVLLVSEVPKILKEKFYSCKLTFLTSSWAAPLLEQNPFIDEVLVFDAPWFSKGRYAKGCVGVGFFELIRILRKKKIGLGVGFRGDLRENLILWLSGVRRRVGYGITGGGFFLTKEVIYRRGVHESEHALDLIRSIGVDVGSPAPRLYFSEREISSLDAVRQKFGLEPGTPYVGLQVTAGSSAKEWPAENLEVFFRNFRRRFPKLTIVLVGLKHGKMNEILQSLDVKCINLLGKTSLRELCLLMKSFLMFVGPDSGPTHLAATLGVPTIFLFSGTNRLEQWRPLEESAVVLRQEVPCAPCGLEVCNISGHPCMSQIDPEKVLTEIGRKLN